MRCEKWHALANDFLIVDRSFEPAGDPARFAAPLCDRRRGAGADGVLVIEPAGDSGEAGDSEKFAGAVRAVVSVWNADGSRAETSGNGTRCAAAYLMRLRGSEACALETAAGVSRHAIVSTDGPSHDIESRFGRASFTPEAIGLTQACAEGEPIELDCGGRRVTGIAVSVGNPHFVVFEAADDWRAIGRAVELDPLFANRTNVEFVRVLERGVLRVRVWERGVGETASSGTGASASFAAARRAGLVDDRVEVRLDGGALSLREEADGLSLTGSCERIGTFETDPSWWERCS